MRAVLGCVLLFVLLCVFEPLEEMLSIAVFGHARDLKDWRRRRHPANSVRTWTLFGR